jgi:hypothetical protein
VGVGLLPRHGVRVDGTESQIAEGEDSHACALGGPDAHTLPLCPAQNRKAVLFTTIVEVPAP